MTLITPFYIRKQDPLLMDILLFQGTYYQLSHVISFIHMKGIFHIALDKSFVICSYSS